MYDDLIVTIMNEFLHQKLYRESDLAKKLGVKEKFLGAALGKMATHFLLQKYAFHIVDDASNRRVFMARLLMYHSKCRATWEAKGTHTTPTNQHWGQAHKSYYVWFLDLNIMCDTMLYRFAASKLYLEERLKRLRDEVVRCDNCNKVWTQLSITEVLQPNHTYMCDNPTCRRVLVPVDNRMVIKETEAALEVMRVRLTPLLDQLISLSRSNHQAGAAASGGAGTTGSKMGGYARPASKPTTATQKKKVGTQIKTLSSVRPGSAQSATQVKEEEDPAAYPFDCALIHYANDHIIKLPVITSEEIWKREKGHQLAKDLLETMAVLEEIQDGHFCYKVTKLSLYQARQRGLRASEIVRLLEQLSKQPIPASLFAEIMNEHAYEDLFKGWIKLHNGKVRGGFPRQKYVSS
jgi:hypothetical protein